MSAETMIGFMEKLESDATFQEEFETALGSTEDTGATVIEFASRHGFEVTEEDCRALASVAEGELNDDALEGVAGGGTFRGIVYTLFPSGPAMSPAAEAFVKRKKARLERMMEGTGKTYGDDSSGLT